MSAIVMILVLATGFLAGMQTFAALRKYSTKEWFIATLDLVMVAGFVAVMILAWSL